MAYIHVKDFKLGMDRRSARLNGPPGSLWTLENGLINRAGEIERAKRFVSTYTLPASTFGLHATATSLYVFGSASAPTMPSGVLYQRLQHEGGQAMAKIRDTENFGGKIYAIAEYANGDVRHFWDGTRISGWDGLGKATRCLTHKRRMYCIVAGSVYYSKLDAPDYPSGADADAGFIQVRNQTSLSETLVSLAPYQGSLALFAKQSIQIWNMSEDDAQNAISQIITNTGTACAKSVQEYGSRDTFYLANSGVRSLRVREGQSAAFVNDPGSPIDPVLSDIVRGLNFTERSNVCSVIDTLDGRFWMCVDGKVYVLSYFPSNKISAWSYIDAGLDFTEMLVFEDRVYARAGDAIYLYGGASNATYPSTGNLTVELPFFDAGKAATPKMFRGFDIACTGTWSVDLLVDPNKEASSVRLGTVTGTSWGRPRMSFQHETTHIAPKLVCPADGSAATLSSLAIHYDETPEAG